MSEFQQRLDREEPTMAVSVSGAVSQGVLAELVAIQPVVEFRADLSLRQNEDYLRNQLQSFVELPVLLTVQQKTEGGRWDGTDVQRVNLFSGLIAEVAAVDVGDPRGMQEVTALAKQEDKSVIISKHFTDGTPDLSELEDTMNQAFEEYGADYAKLAVKVTNLEDLRRLTVFTLKNVLKPIISVGMTEHGKLSRLDLPILGSRLGYTYPAGIKPTAPGQMDHRETHGHFMRFSPGYRDLYRNVAS